MLKPAGSRLRNLAFALTLGLTMPMALPAQAQDPAPIPRSSPRPSPAANPTPSPTPSPSPSASPLAPPAGDTVRDHYRRQEIESATALELAASLKSLGLSVAGSPAELRQRLLAYYRLDQASANSPPPGTPAPAASPSPAASPVASGTKPLDVSIESAGSAKYFTVEEVDETYLRLSGGVVLVVNDGAKNTTHRIKAERIMYNRKQDTMIAQGDVSYKLTENGKDQQFTGSEMRFSLNTMEVFLLDGVLYNQHAVDGATLNFRIEGDQIGRVDRNLSVINQASVSSSQSSPESYRVSAGHIWVLQSGEWAVSDGVLYVGRVPVMYIPFFYFPSDELFFHPVAGYQDPEGAFLQTTTYLLGQKAKSQAPLSFMQFDEGGSGSTTTRAHGLWLERIAKSSAPVASPAPSASPPPGGPTGPGASPAPTASPAPGGLAASDYIKLLIDGYSRYGYLTGFQGKLTLASLGSLDFTAAAGFSRNLYTGLNGVSTYYLKAGEMEKEYWDSGYFYGTVLPFRFLLDLQASLKTGGYQLGLNIPLASDPSFRADFLSGRKEDINWEKIIGLDKSAPTGGSTPSAGTDSMNMSITNSWNPDLAVLRPFVDTIALNNLDASIGWTVRTWTTPIPEVSSALRSASLRFWAPELLTLPKMGMTVSGTLLQYPWVSPKPPAASPGQGSTAPSAGSEPASRKDLPAFLFPESEYVAPLSAEEKKKQDAEAKAQSAEPKIVETEKLLEVDPQGAATSGFKLNDWQARLAYSVIPGLAVTSRFAAADSNDPVKIADGQNYWTMQDRFSGNLHLTGATPLNLFSLDSLLNFSGQDQTILQSDPLAPAAILANIQQESVKARYLTLDNADVLKFSPLAGIKYVDTSYLEYGLAMVMYRYKWDSGITVDTATYKTESLELFTGKSKEFITKHYAGLNLGFVTPAFSTRWSAQYTLPPLAQSIVGHGDLGLFGGKATLSADETFNIADDYSKVTPAPLTLALNLPLVDWFSTSHNLIYDVDKMKLTSYNGNVNLFGFNGSLMAKSATDQVYDQTIHNWKPQGEESFRVVSGSLDYSLNIEPDPFWFNRMKTKFTLTGRWSQNFITVTDSTLSWNLAWNYSVAEFLNLDFSVGGQNARLFRYSPEYNRLLGLPASQDKDFFTDLLQSFNFGDDAKRQGSYFKMSSLAIKAIHYLGDWQLTVSYTGTPTVQTVNNVQSMVWTYQFSAFIAWVPIPEIKSTIKSSKDLKTNLDVLSIE